MLSFTRKSKAFIVPMGLFLVLTITSASAQAQSSAGIVRISDGGPTAAVGHGSGPACGCNANRCATCGQGCGCPVAVHEGHGCRLTGNPIIDWCKIHKMKLDANGMRHLFTLRAHYRDKFDRCQQCGGQTHDGYCPNCANGCPYCQNGDASDQERRCKYGYFYPTGCCGQGCPPIDHYSMVYATNPGYFDQRDGKIFSAEGFNIPVSVPLAPNVRHTYNYGWGIPSSRRTPISRFIPEAHMLPAQP